MKNNQSLTNKNYWENFYKNHKESAVDKSTIEIICGKYDYYYDIFIDRSKEKKTIIEIGAYPGRYISYISSKYYLNPTSFDFNSDQLTIKEHFKKFEIPNYNLISGDFTKNLPREKYDHVFSNGFVEHFENYDLILDNHFKLCKNNGRIFIMIPNKKYLRKYYGYLCDYENLKKHNLKSMSLTVFKNFAKRNGLEILRLEYFGGFSYNVHQSLNIFQRIIYGLTRRLFKYILNPVIEKFPNRFFSGTIIAIFKKKP